MKFENVGGEEPGGWPRKIIKILQLPNSHFYSLKYTVYEL